jgi:hypothetical protein
MWALFEGSIWLAVLFEHRRPVPRASLQAVAVSAREGDR